jgi:hypothetical protein
MEHLQQQPNMNGRGYDYGATFNVKDEEKRKKQLEADRRKQETERKARLVYAHSVLTKSAFGKLVSYHYAAKQDMNGDYRVTDGDKVRKNAVALLQKDSDADARSRAGLPQLQSWQQLIYIPALGISGAIGAIAQRLSDKLFKSDNYTKVCAQYAIFQALINNVGSNLFISSQNISGQVFIDSDIEELMRSEMVEGGDIRIDEALSMKYADNLMDLVTTLAHVVVKRIGNAIDSYRFNTEQNAANANIGVIAEAAQAENMLLSQIFREFMSRHYTTMDIDTWIRVETSHKKPTASYQLGYGNLLEVARRIGTVESFSFSKIPLKYHRQFNGKLVGYSFMPDLSNPADATKWANSQILNVKFTPFEKKASGRVKSGDIATKASFCLNLESRFLSYNSEQLTGLVNGTKYFDPTAFVSTKGTGLDLKEQKETQKLFPTATMDPAIFNFLRRLRDESNGSPENIQERNNIVITIVLACLKTGKRKFPAVGTAPSAEFNELAGKVESLLRLLGVGLEMMNQMSRTQINMMRTMY